MELLIPLLVLALVIVVVYYVVDLIGLPQPANNIVKLILALIFILKLLSLVGVNTGMQLKNKNKR